MILLIALLALAVWAVVATIIELRRDGHRRVPTDWTRVAPKGMPSTARRPATSIGDPGRAISPIR
ncbi:hypothetical protein LJR204_003446 [Microbacterium foliorum]